MRVGNRTIQNTHETSEKNRFRISEEAALWLIRLEEDDTPECRAEFTAWSRQSPQHVEEFLFAQATLQHLDPIDPERKIDLAALDTEGDAAPSFRWASRRRRRPSRPLRRVAQNKRAGVDSRTRRLRCGSSSYRDISGLVPGPSRTYATATAINSRSSSKTDRWCI